jgi:hypothetical protein
MMDLVLAHADEFKEPQEYYAEIIKPPYLCNSCFVIKTDTWRKIIDDKILYNSPYDEVPLNLYRERHDLSYAFIRNAFGVHGMYGDCILDRQDENENRGAKETWFWEEFGRRVCS